MPYDTSMIPNYLNPIQNLVSSYTLGNVFTGSTPLDFTNLASQKAATRVPVGGAGGPSGNDALNQLILRLSQATGPTSTTTGSTLVRQNPSPQLQGTMDDFIRQLNQLSGGFQTAYQGKQDAYQDVINALTNTYGRMGSAASGAARSGALATGLTPLEAAGAGQSSMLDVLGQYYPQLSGLRQEQAGVGVDLQSALAGLQQNLNLPFITNVASPYYQGVAGKVTEGNQTTTDNLARQSLLANLLQVGNDDWYKQQQLALQAQELAQRGQLSLAQMEQQGSQFQQSQSQSMKLQQEQMAQRLYETLTGRQWQSGERRAGEQYQTGERRDTQSFQRETQQKAMMNEMLRMLFGNQLGSGRLYDKESGSIFDQEMNRIFGDMGD